MNIARLVFWSLLGAALTLPAPGWTENLKLRFAYQDRIGSVIPAVAVRQGFLAQEGLDVATLQFNSGPACSEALYSGAADIAGMGDTAALIIAARASNMRLLASHATGEHRHRIMVRTDSPLTRLTDLAGKSVGVKKGTSTHGGLLLALIKAGVSDVTLIDLSPPTQVEALNAGSIDALAASEPTPSAAELKGARELTTLGGLGNAYPIMLVAKKSFIDANPEALARFFRALRRAEAYIAANPEDVVRFMAEQSGLELETTRKAMAQHVYKLRLDSSITSSLEQTADFLEREHIIEHKPDLATIIEARFMR